jgi:RNA polymerase sigma-32 factor
MRYPRRWDAIFEIERLDEEQENELIRKWQQDKDHDAAAYVIVSNIRYAFSIVRFHAHSGHNIHELISEACVGIIRAIDDFDTSRGIRFSKYAMWWMRHRVSRFVLRNRMICSGLATHGSTIPVVRNKMIHAEAAGMNPRSEHIIKQIAKELGVTTDRVTNAMNIIQGGNFSIDAKIFDNGKTSILDTMKCESTNPEEEINEKQKNELIKKMLEVGFDHLDSRDMEIIKRYAVPDKYPQSMAHMGRELGLSRERIRQLEERALKRMKRAIKEKFPKQELEAIGIVNIKF